MKAEEGVVTKTELLQVIVMDTLETGIEEETHQNVLRRNDKYIEELLKE
jgi:hypothetical protein